MYNDQPAKNVTDEKAWEICVDIWAASRMTAPNQEVINGRVKAMSSLYPTIDELKGFKRYWDMDKEGFFQYHEFRNWLKGYRKSHGDSELESTKCKFGICDGKGFFVFIKGGCETSTLCRCHRKYDETCTVFNAGGYKAVKAQFESMGYEIAEWFGDSVLNSKINKG